MLVGLLLFKGIDCKKNYEKEFNKDLAKIFFVYIQIL